MMNVSINYNPDAYLITRFIDHGRFALHPDMYRFGTDKNLIEKLGDGGLWVAEQFPKRIWKWLKEPRLITIFIATISFGGVSVLFYPEKSAQLIKRFIALLPLPTYEQVKFATYLTTVGHIFAFSLRAYGRFSNQELMNHWYSNDGQRQEIGQGR